MTVDAVRYALAELGRARLLAGPAPAGPGVTRRELMRRLGATAAAAVPIVASIAVPTAAQAQAPSPSPQVCPSLDPQGSCVHPLCETGESLDPECHPCVALICEEDGACCASDWDNICVGEVAEICNCPACT